MKQLRGDEAHKYFKNLTFRKQEICLILENIQYATNVANIFRTAEAAGVKKVYLTGISKKPPFGKDLIKVSRGMEQKVNYDSAETTLDIIPLLKSQGFHIIAIELSDTNVPLFDLKSYLKDKQKVCFIAGNEDSGINKTTLEQCDTAVTIPMFGENASLNVNVSVGIVLFNF